MTKKIRNFSLILFLFFCFFQMQSSIAETNDIRPILRVAGWDVYADPEQRNKTIGYKSFEEQTGYRIEFTPLSNLDQIIHFAETQSNIDVLIISNEGIETLYKMQLVKSIDYTAIPYYQELHHHLRYNQWSQFEGKMYAVPWAWGPTGLLYDSERVPTPESWNILWDPKYKFKVSLWDDMSMIWTTALALGYKNVYNLTQEQLDKVKEKLLELNQQVFYYYKGEQDEISVLASGEVLITNSWFDPSRRLSAHNKKFKMVIPKEGAVGMFDSFLMSKHSQLYDVSLKYINHQISPSVQLEMSQITGLSPSNIETLSLMSQQEIKALHLDEQNYFNKMILWDVMPRKHLYDQVIKEVRNNMKTRTLTTK